MNAESAKKLVEASILVPVIRAPSAAQAEAAVLALRAGGVNIFEVTLTVPNALELIESLCERFKADEQVLVGAGTVTTVDQSDACLKAGSQFIVSPGTNLSMIADCNKRKTAILPGALTPTEVITAYQAGADMVKIFPCSAMGGASYLKALKAPLPHVPLLPTGGVSEDTALDFLKAGASALGVGANLVDIALLESEGPEALTARAQSFVNKVRSFKS